MARVDKLLSDEAKNLFPITTIDSLEKLFRILLARENEPNLALISILLGVLEHSLTNSYLTNVDKTESPQVVQHGPEIPAPVTPNPAKIHQLNATNLANSSTKKSMLSKRRNSTKRRSQRIKSFVDENGVLEGPEVEPKPQKDFPPLELDIVLSLYEQFYAIVYSSVILYPKISGEQVETEVKSEETSPVIEVTESKVPTSGVGVSSGREQIKSVSDIIWNSLSKTYVFEKPHLQSLYTYLTGNKLDSFGMALSVVAACQILHLNDVHLVLSEDHAWVSYGPNGEKSCEVTWHGKNAEDKRGQPVFADTHSSWLYLNGCAVKCLNRHMEVAAIISAINSTISSTTDSIEMTLIQQKLLWLLFDAGHLQQYPMAIGNLADLEETYPTPGRPTSPQLFEQAIEISKKHYSNMHVYPYTFYGGYLYRQQQFKEALEYWAAGSHVLSQYRYDKDDEEIYRDYLEITKDYLPSIMKQCTEGISAGSITRDPLCFACLLRLYDGICLWEEISSAPIVHIVWAKHWVSAIGKFDSSVRGRVTIHTTEISSDDTPVKGDKTTSATTTSSQDILVNPDLFMHDFSVISSLATELCCDFGDILSSIEGLESSLVAYFPDNYETTVDLAKVAAASATSSDSNLLSLIAASFPSSSTTKGIGVKVKETNNNTVPAQESGSGIAVVIRNLKQPSQLSINTPIQWTTDDNGEPGVIIQLFSQKMRSVGELLNRGRFNSSTLTLMLTAQTLTEPNNKASTSTNTATNTVRSRRSRTGTGATVASSNPREEVGGVLESRKLKSQPVVETAAANANSTSDVKLEVTSSAGVDIVRISNSPVSLPPKKRARKV